MRLIVQQPALAKYRLPFFREIASRPNISLTVYYGCVDGLPNEKPDGFPGVFEPYRVIKIRGSDFYWHSAQWRHLNRREADVVALSWSTRYLSLVPSLLRARALGLPVVLWGHGYSKNETPFRLWTRNIVAKMGTAIILYDHRTAKDYVARGWSRDRVYVAPNSLDQQAIKRAREQCLADPAKLAGFRDKSKLSPGKTLIYVGRIYPENRLDVLIKALPKIIASHDCARLVVIGKVNAHANELKQLSLELGVAERIQWLGAIYDENELAPWMLSSSLFCYPSNIGLSIMHAMGYGLPVITGDCIAGHNPEIEVLRPNENGMVFADSDSAALADTVNRLLSNQALCDKMSASALQTIQDGYNIEKMADGFVAAAAFACSTRKVGN